MSATQSMLFAGITIAFLFFVWARRSYTIFKLFIRLEEMRSWNPVSAEIEGILWTGSPRPGKLYILRSFWSKIAGREKFHFRARYQIGDIVAVCDKFSVFPSLRASDRLFLRRILRSGENRVTLYQNPDNPLECVLLPPEDHRIRGYAIRHLAFTALVCASIVILVV